MRRIFATTFSLSLVLAFASGADSAVRQDEQPRVTNHVKPSYPPTALAARVEGVVNVGVEVDAEGNVADAKAEEAAHPLLRETAEEAARHWKFELSATREARPARLTFEFRWEAAAAGAEDEKPASPYHVVIRRVKKNTVSRVPAGADNMTCGVHGFKLEKDKVRIVYGLAILNPDYEEAAAPQFPNANTEYGGGCVITDDNPEFAEVLFCAACRAAQTDWLAARRARAGGD